MKPYAVCSCGRRFTKRAWKRLEYVGVWHLPAEAGYEEQNLEMRNCVCRSTMSVDLGPGAARETGRARDTGRRRFPRVTVITPARLRRLRALERR